MVGDTGIEPVTSSVSGKRATAAPIAPVCPRRAVEEMERTTGFEPATSTLARWCSSQLSYVRAKLFRITPACFSGRYWDRTSDLFRVREARYRCANRP
jgi:hypothetical protein